MPNMNAPRIMIVAGEASGDLHGSKLVAAMREQAPDLAICGIGGPELAAQGVEILYDASRLAVVGIVEVISHFRFIREAMRALEKRLREQPPRLLILIDYPDFNLILAKKARRLGIPVFYYISPQVWASRPGRAAKLAKLTREMFVIFPFEADIYKKVKGNATFVGHPLLDLMPEPGQKDFPPADGAWKIGILPGSRKTEISRHLPLFMKAFYRIKESHPKARAYLFAVPEFPDDRIVPELEAVEKYWSKDIEIVREKDYKLRAQMDFAFTCSGTATLENALLGVPMAVAYKMQKLTYAIAKRVAKVQYISLVNILLKKPAVKELIQEAATVDNLAQDAFAYINTPPRMQAARKELMGLRTMLGERGAAERAAARILAHLS